MEVLKSNDLLSDGRGEKLAIILCSQNEILTKVTYNEVFDHADKIKNFMLKNVEEDNICIGLCMEKNIFVPSIILSFQKLKNSFVFSTAKTLSNTVQNLNIKWILSYEDDPSQNYFILEDTLQFLTGEKLKLWRKSNYCKNEQHLSFKDVFCAVQTSGSTGETKIVRVPHACIEKNILSLNKHFVLSNSDIIYWGTPLTFDPTLVEFLLGIFCQATLLIVPKLVSLNPGFLCNALFKIGCASFVQMVPSVFLRWNKEQIASILGYTSLKTLALGGEQFPQEIFGYDWHKELKVFNLYGVTELSCWATISKVTCKLNDENQVTLGEALDETYIELRSVDDEVELDGIGEIYIGSHSRYCLLNDHDMNTDFPFVVKTGDLGEFIDQKLVYRGRKIRTVKRCGYRVNLHKIEDIILKETNLSSRLVYSQHHKKLLAFILIEESFNKNTKIRLLDKLRVKLLKILSEYEFPDFIDVVMQFPLSEHGKICDKILEKYYETSLNNLIMKEPPTNVFIHILDCYLKTEFSNNVESLGKQTFFELGGNSVVAMQLLSEFRDLCGNDTPGELVTLLLNDNLEACINYVGNNISFKRKLLEADVSEKPKKIIMESKKSNCVVWTYDLKGCVDSSPLVFEKSNKAYVAAGSFAHIFAILNENGEEYIKLNFSQEVEGTPCVSKCGNLIFIGCSNGAMYCIDFSLKKVSWEYHTLQKVTSAACLCRNSSAMVFGSYDNFAYCLTTENGRLFWKTKLSGSIRADPLYYETLKTIYIGTTQGTCYALNEEDGAVIWTHKLDGPIFGSPCIVNGFIFWSCVTGVLYGISLSGNLKWMQKINGNIFSSLTVSENKIYFGCQDCRVYEVAVSDDDIKISKNFQLESEISSTPLVYKCENKVLMISVCNVGVLYVIELNSGNIVFKYQLPAESFSSPCIFKNKIYVGCRDNNLYCIDIEKALIN